MLPTQQTLREYSYSSYTMQMVTFEECLILSDLLGCQCKQVCPTRRQGYENIYFRILQN